MVVARRSITLTAALVAVVASATTVAAQRGDGPLRPAATVNPEVAYSVALDGDNEVPPADPDGMGTAAVTVNSSTGQVCVNVTTTAIEPIQAMHIHEGAAGVNGPVVVDFAVTSGTTAAKCVTVSASQAAAVNAAPTGFYLNVHTATYPDGAIRGQLAPRGNSIGAAELLTEPVRAYDSRGSGAAGLLGPNQVRTVNLRQGVDGNGAAVAAVPAGARAALVTLTVTQTVDGGYLTLFSNAIEGVPATSTVNWTASNSDVATTTTVLLDGTGSVKVAAGPRGTHFIIDVIGYYA
jgi:hypothetical protein